jgi:plastocyanin
VSAVRRLPALPVPLALAAVVLAGCGGEGWTSGDPQRSGTFTHTFDRPGTYPYRCTLHDGMDGRVVVTGS